jgi:hypothetical protein
VFLAARTKTAGCRRGAEPDRACSPGAYYSGLTSAVICSAGFRTGPIRNVPDSVQSAVEREHGMPARSYGRAIEIDHIVSLELGGSNDIANLFPEPGSGAASYHEKDRLENRLHDVVCRGQMGLRGAQLAIASDWIMLYRRVLNVAPKRWSSLSASRERGRPCELGRIRCQLVEAVLDPSDGVDEVVEPLVLLVVGGHES